MKNDDMKKTSILSIKKVICLINLSFICILDYFSPQRDLLLFAKYTTVYQRPMPKIECYPRAHF